MIESNVSVESAQEENHGISSFTSLGVILTYCSNNNKFIVLALNGKASHFPDVISRSFNLHFFLVNNPALSIINQ